MESEIDLGTKCSPEQGWGICYYIFYLKCLGLFGIFSTELHTGTSVTKWGTITLSIEEHTSLPWCEQSLLMKMQCSRRPHEVADDFLLQCSLDLYIQRLREWGFHARLPAITTFTSQTADYEFRKFQCSHCLIAYMFCSKMQRFVMAMYCSTVARYTISSRMYSTESINKLNICD